MFREDKTTQMAARFLQLAGKRLPYIQLLKLLYLADKQMLTQHGKPITYDRWYAMKYGPVLSSTYDLIKGNNQSEYWSDYIQTANYDVVLCSDPGSDALSVTEDRIIEAVFEEYKDRNWQQMVDVTHQLPEWENSGSASKEITYEEVLQIEGFDKEDIDNILDNIRVQNDVHLVLETL